ncbi:hypothetical protein AB0J63_26675 [Streptosporangium canum]|uniref:hypothetical protein n=1 Tax=Streptosporangium canum TaxID=324952 RepID=UPI00343E5FC0
MTAPTLKPLVVFDSADNTYWNRASADAAWYDSLLGWVRQHGIDPPNTYRLEVYLLDCPFARVYEFDLDKDGRKYVAGSDYARREPRDVLLSSLPPAPAVPEETS